MALQKQSITINFSQGLDTKTDPKQVPVGKFSVLENSVFNKGGQLTKRNGYGPLTSLPDTNSSYLTTFKENLTAIGNNIQAYSSGSNSWVQKGSIAPLSLETLPIIRSNTNQSYADLAIASNNVACAVYTDQNLSSLGSPQYRFVIFDSVTGQNIVAPTVITPATGAVLDTPKVFLLGNYFIIVFCNNIAGAKHLQYIAISTISPTTMTANVEISSSFTPSTTGAFDGVVANNSLYLAWAGADMGGAIRAVKLNSFLTLGSTFVFTGQTATIVSVTADQTGNVPQIYISIYDLASTNGFTLSTDQNLNQIFTFQAIITAKTVTNLASCAHNGACSVFSEIENAYSYDSGIDTDYINAVTVSRIGSVGTPYVMVRSVGLASKAFIIDDTCYVLTAYQSPYQPSYFLIDATHSTENNPRVVAKLAYGNGGGYLTTGLPNAVVSGSTVQFPYLIKDLIAAVNKNTNVPSNSQVNGIYSQTGINMATIVFTSDSIDVAEIGDNLNISGGFLRSYDGYLPVENNFFLWPDSVELSTSTGSGGLVAQEYFYQVTYEWSDNQGNIYRSAPSIPVNITTTTGSSTNTIKVPTLRLTFKIENPVKIVVYRWSTAQQVYYQVTSLTAPILNSTTADSVAITDAATDASILGNNILYTTGGVVEDINGPASNLFTLFDNRLWIVDSEDRNLVWYSKQVIENTPVEMSNLLTIFIAPTTGAQGSTGPITALTCMDDKIIIFKNNAIYYINGTGPDNTGANSQYSQPIFITSTVGCTNQRSIVFTPMGLMFQSNKGIWMLKRDLSTDYIGAAVEQFNNSVVQSAVNVPQTNQVRFTLDTGQTLMFDYYYQQWGTFVGVPATSSTIYSGLHTFINQYGQVYQETPGQYLDGSNPVRLKFTTSWLNLAGLQGYERLYYFYFLGDYISPHKLAVKIAYEYNPAPQQQTIISPDNFTPPYGGDALYGQSSPYGGNGSLEQWKITTQRQLTQAFQITIEEIFNPFFESVAGAGFTASGITCMIGIKKGDRPIDPVRTA